MKFFFPIHLNGGNRGCEAIAKGTAKVLGSAKEDIIGYCTDVALDQRLGVDDMMTLVPFRKPSISFRAVNKIYRLLEHDDVKRQFFLYSYEYNHFLNQIADVDFMLSTGGDMFCYSNCQVNYTVDYLAARNKKTILWGCSIGKNNLTPEKIVSLHNFTAVVARESLTQELFKEMGLKKIFLYPDPAFALEPEKCNLPEYMRDGEIIGVNFSNFVGYDVSVNTLLGKNIRNLVAYILKHTNMKILFIPHVLWAEQDDRIICSEIYNEFNETNRLFLLDSDKYNYCQIRYIISKCSLFIGARTHAVISAYSTCTPAMALGYSIKSKGIAKDLGLPESSVVNSIGVTSANEMSEGFAAFLSNAENMRHHLQMVIPEYKSRLEEASGIFANL